MLYHKTPLPFELVSSNTIRIPSSHFLKVKSKIPCSSHLLQENNYYQIKAYSFTLSSLQVKVVDN